MLVHSFSFHFVNVKFHFLNVNIMGLLGDIFSIIASPFQMAADEEARDQAWDINALNQQFNREEAEKNRQFQSEQSDIMRQFNAEQAAISRKSQQDFDREMFEKENAYNTPANQLKLLTDAGINPNLLSPGFVPSSGSTNATAQASTSAPGGSQASLPSYPVVPSISIPNLDLAFIEHAQNIKSMKEDIKSKELANRDKENELRAKEEKLPFVSVSDSVDEDSQYVDDDGFHYVVDVLPSLDSYQEARQKGRVELEALKRDLKTKSVEFDILFSSAPVLKKMKTEELNSLLEDIRAKRANNTLLEMDVNMMHKYGISPNDNDAWQSLLKMALRNPNAFDNVLTALANAVKVTGMSFWNKLNNGADNLFQSLIDFFGDGSKTGSW